MTQKTERPWWLTEALLIGAATGVGYLAAFLREWVRDSYFGIPHELVVLDSTKVIGSVWVTIALYFMGLRIFSDSIHRAAGQWRGRADPPPPLFLAALMLLIPFGGLIGTAWFWGLIAAAIVLEMLIARRRRSNAVRQTENAKQTPPALMSPLVLVLTTVWFLLISGASGAYEARGRLHYVLAAAGPPELVVLKFFGGNVIAAPLNRKTGTVKREFHVLPLENRVLRQEDLGTLRVE